MRPLFFWPQPAIIAIHYSGKGCLHMGYFYAILWFIVGIILIFSVSKENKIFCFAGAFFIFLGGWWLADAILPQNLFQGRWGWVFRIITLLALAVFSVAFYLERRRTIRQQEQEGDQEKESDGK